MFNPTSFDTSVSSSGRFKTYTSLSYVKFLKLMLLKLQFHKIIRTKYIKILFGRHRVIQKNLRNITISCASSVFMWLYIQSLVGVVCVMVWHVTYTCALAGCNKNTINMLGTCIKMLQLRVCAWINVCPTGSKLYHVVL